MTYAKALSSYPSIKNQEYTAAIPNMNKIPASTSQKSQHEVDESSSDHDNFIGVKRKRNKTKLFVTGIDENVKESQILSFLKRRNVIPTYISSGVASEKILVMPLWVCPKLTRRHHGWRRARKFFKFRASRSSETAFSDIYLFIFVGTIWSI